MPLRLKLLLIAMVTAVFPLAGWRFVVQMEATLRQSQERALLASARTLANALPAADGELRAALIAPAVLHARPMQVDIVADGYPDDWGSWHLAPETLASENGSLHAELYVGRSPGAVHLWLDVADATPVVASADASLDERADHVDVWVRDRYGERRWRVLRRTDGIGAAQPMPGPDGRQPGFELPAAWIERGGGYRVELRLPQTDPALELAIDVRDYPVAGADLPRASASSGVRGLRYRALAPLWRESPLLRSLVPDNARLRVLDREGYVLARSGRLRPGSDTSDDDGDLSFLRWLRALVYRHLLAPPMTQADGYEFNRLRVTVPQVDAAMTGTPGASWRPAASQASVILTVALPLLHGSDVVGVVMLEQTSDALLLWTNRALGSLLLGGLLTMLVAAAILFGYAGYLSWRIRKLRNAAENALTVEGRVVGNFPRSSAVDEIGDLSRSFGRLLDQVSAYTDYLRTLGGKLSHELATPLAVVKSSLENLEQESMTESARIYAERARSGAERLGALLRTLSQASRIESAITAAEAEDFDLREFLIGATAGYRDLAEDRDFQLAVPEQPVPFRGAPELIHQALDKLVDNALGFCPPGGHIRLALESRIIGSVDIVLSNNGPPLPQKMQDRLFDSLISVRDGRATMSPHLGLGLYIVRLVAELHQGEASAANLPDMSGVEFRMRMRGMR
ncbi:MAG: histidine kinase [Xanthomonadales bacterium]|nr:Adaptive-response sensory-kinase SasA [Xanthomonadales bacterium]MCC6593749.1 histidine kinase [Xanthomonadales bacterium]MCE7932482.1 histidine kinase [Xanthomonadales bacterium PRO6]